MIRAAFFALLLPGASSATAPLALPNLDSLALAECLAITPDQQSSAIKNYKVHFEGLQKLTGRELRGACTDEEFDLVKNGYRRAEVDDMAFQMEVYAKGQGYAFARVQWRYEIKQDILHATFLVQEGPRPVLRDISFAGSTVFASEDLLHFVTPGDHSKLDDESFYVASRVDSVPGAIQSLYQALGYLNIEVEKPLVTFTDDRAFADVHVVIHEGTCYRIRTLEFSGQEIIPQEQLQELGAHLIGQGYFPRRAFELKQRVVDELLNHGYALANATVERLFNHNNGAVTLSVIVDPGPLVYIGAIEVSGNRRTSDNFIRNRLEIAEGDRSNRKSQDESFRNLYRTGLFKHVELGLQGEGNRQNLMIEVEESMHQEFIVEPGYGSYEKLRLMVGWRHKNIFGTGRILRTEAEASMKSMNALIGITDPWLFDSDVELDAPLFFRNRQEPSFTREEAGLALQFRYPFTRKLSMIWGYRVTRSRVDSESAGLPPDILIGDVTMASVFFGPRYDTRNDYFNPTSGGQNILQFEYGAEALGSQVEYLRGGLTLTRYFPLNDSESTVLALGYRSGIIQPIAGTETIPLQLRMFNGGENSARGFSESRLGPLDSLGQPIGGEAFNTLNLELRQRLSNAMWSGVFFDYGNVAFEAEDFLEDFRPTVGAGLRYLLPVGALRLDYGYNLTRRSYEDQYLIHLSVGMAF